MKSVTEVPCNVRTEIEIRTGSPGDANQTVFRFSVPGSDDFRFISRNGGEPFRGTLYGIVVASDKIGDYKSKVGSFLGTQLQTGHWAIPTGVVKIGDEMAINLEGFPANTYHSRPIVSISVP